MKSKTEWKQRLKIFFSTRLPDTEKPPPFPLGCGMNPCLCSRNDCFWGPRPFSNWGVGGPQSPWGVPALGKVFPDYAGPGTVANFCGPPSVMEGKKKVGLGPPFMKRTASQLGKFSPDAAPWMASFLTELTGQVKNCHPGPFTAKVLGLTPRPLEVALGFAPWAPLPVCGNDEFLAFPPEPGLAFVFFFFSWNSCPAQSNCPKLAPPGFPPPRGHASKLHLHVAYYNPEAD